MADVKTMYKKVAKAVEALIRALGTQENKVIKVGLADHHRVNRCFDLLGLTYPDWSSMELKDAEGSMKRKRAEVGGELVSTSKQGGCGCGRAGASKVDRATMEKVAASSVASLVVAAKPESTVSLGPRSSVVGGPLPGHKMPSISRLPILQIILDDEGDDEEGKEVSEGSEEVKVDGSSSSSSSSESSASGDEDDVDDDEQDESGDPWPIGSEELGFQGRRAEEGREIESRMTRSGSMPRHRHVHIMREGCEVATDEDEPRAGSEKHAPGEASRSGLRHFRCFVRR